ncbi:MAG: tRNA (adenosine(37)-N6)-dimethylallyltransferase MiaA [Armatimonadetes bacterium]|jgi:tRNA dimethylallyltransferase|nr:tRNA (adenosine(37)-N6)-dimethylallyltransferase MiaA [Armatimonadota bacterium]HOC31292.1 tRNA (adenosine(37)-N6)-dimethylallyltransferase MiaA [Armatimonadota bacterium]
MRSANPPLLPLVCGPTGVGKTAVSLGVAKDISAEIVSADSMAVYQGLEVATAKPTVQERAIVPHHLVDVVDVSEPFTVADFVRLARTAIDDILCRGRLPLVVGGTRQYINALTQGFVQAPGSDPAVRERLEHEAEEQGLSVLRERLERIDPDTFSRLHPNDLRRTVRALEVFELTGRTMTSWQTESREDAPYRRLLFGLTRDREALYDRINRRVDAMMDAGLEDEVRALLNLRRLGPTAIQGHGYKEIVGYLRGEYGREHAVYLLKRNTRWHARHQLSWLRQQPDTVWIDLDGGEEKAREEIVGMIDRPST